MSGRKQVFAVPIVLGLLALGLSLVGAASREKSEARTGSALGSRQPAPEASHLEQALAYPVTRGMVQLVGVDDDGDSHIDRWRLRLRPPSPTPWPDQVNYQTSVHGFEAITSCQPSRWEPGCGFFAGDEE